MILITGASRGIGKYLFEKFISDDNNVIGTYLSTKPDKFNDNYYKVDVSNYKEVENWIKSIPYLKNITLINCAAINYNSFTHKADCENWKKVVETNLIGSFNTIRYVLPFMRDDRYGRIINFSSVVAQMGVFGTSAYAASKSGLWGLTKAICSENAKYNITINSLNLGYFNIGIIRDIKTEMLKQIKENIPTGEFGNPIEIYNVIKLLMDSNYINGTSIDINGGLI